MRLKPKKIDFLKWINMNCNCVVTMKRSETSTQRKRRLAKNREYIREKRRREQAEDPEKYAARRERDAAKNREYMREKRRRERAEEPEKYAARLEKERYNRRLALARETQEQYEKRLQAGRLRAAQARAQESETKRKLRIEKDRERTAESRSRESAEQRDARRAKEKERTAESRSRESQEQRDIRRAKDRERTAESRSRESQEQAYARRAIQKERQAQSSFQKSDEQRDAQLAKMRPSEAQRIHKETQAERDARLARAFVLRKIASNVFLHGNVMIQQPVYEIVSFADPCDGMSLNREKIGVENAPPDDGEEGTINGLAQPNIALNFNTNNLKEQIELDVASAGDSNVFRIDPGMIKIENTASCEEAEFTVTGLHDQLGLTNLSVGLNSSVHENVIKQKPINNISSIDNVDRIPIKQELIEADVTSGSMNDGMPSGENQTDLSRTSKNSPLLSTRTQEYIKQEPFVDEMEPLREYDVIPILKKEEVEIEDIAYDDNVIEEMENQEEQITYSELGVPNDPVKRSARGLQNKSGNNRRPRKKKKPSSLPLRCAKRTLTSNNRIIHVKNGRYPSGIKADETVGIREICVRLSFGETFADNSLRQPARLRIS